MESPPRLVQGTINIASFRERLIYYQSMCPEFRYGDEKMLGTQSHPTCDSTSIHYVLRLNLIKDTFNIYHSRLTHILAHIQQTTWHHIIPNPIIHLSCISSYLKPQHTFIIHGIISYPRQKHRHGSSQTIMLSCLRHGI